MIKMRDGYAKLVGTSYAGVSNRVLLSNGDDFGLHTGRNNEANKIVRTDANGYLQVGWINTISGDVGTGTINRIYCSYDEFVRYKTPANFFSELSNSGDNIRITVANYTRTLLINYAKTAGLLRSKGVLAPQTGRTLNLGDVYSYLLNAQVSGGPTTYASVIGFGMGVAGTVEIAGEWTNGRGVWIRALRDTIDNWFAWDRILTESTYAGIVDTRYVTSLGVDGNYLTWIKKNTTNKIMIPYAVDAGHAKYIYANYTSNLNIPTTWNDDGSRIIYDIYNDGASNKPISLNNANGIITFFKSKHGTSGLYTTLLAFPDNGRIYCRFSLAGTFSAWNTVAFTSDIKLDTSDRYWANIKVSTASSTTTSPTFSTAYTSNWFRSTGNTGWYNETYGGGIHMTDSSWVRTYNGKSFYCSNIIQAGNRFYTGYDSGQSSSISCSNWFRSSGDSGWLNATYGGGWHMTESNYVRVWNSKAVYTGNQNHYAFNSAGGYYSSWNNSYSLNDSNTLNHTYATFNKSSTTVLHDTVQPQLVWSNVVSGYGYVTRYSISSIRPYNGSWGRMRLAVGNNDGGSSIGAYLDISGNNLISTGSKIYSSGFVHNSVNSNDYVLLAGGGYKNLSDFAKGNAGAANNGVYVTNGTVTAMTHKLNASVASGSLNKLAYYSGNTSISAYTSTVGFSNIPIYFNTGTPTACTGVLIKYWGHYEVSCYFDTTPTLDKIGGNFNFASSVSRRGEGRYTLATTYPSGYNPYNVICWGSGRLNKNFSSHSPDSILHVTLLNGYLSGSIYYLYINTADDASPNDGVFDIFFLCF